MNTISFSSFSCMQQLDQEVSRAEDRVNFIENELQNTRASTDYYRLFQELEGALAPCKQLVKTASSLDSEALLSRLSLLEKRSTTLYGNLLNKAVEREVVEIESEAKEIERTLATSPMLNTAKKVDQIRCQLMHLKTHILDFKHDHRLSRAEIVQISTVERFIARVEKFLETPTKLAQIRLENMFEMGDIDPATAELLMELFELAELFEANHPLAARKKEKLPVSTQKRIEAHSKTLEAELDFSPEKLQTCAIKAAALELAGGGVLHRPLEALLDYYGGLEALA